MPLLEIENLALEFVHEARTVRVLDGVSLALESGETVCVVGESGSGKSVTALSIARLLPSPPARYPSGEIRLEGRDVLRMSKDELRSIRGGVVGYVFQDPNASLNPVLRISTQIRESLRLHRPEADSEEEVIRLLKLVRVPAPEERMRSFPHEFSGGMQQRVMIAMALAAEPRLLVADEPTTALDVTTQAQILELLSDLKAKLRMGILLITHNFGLVAEMGDRVAVMYAGQVVESAPAGELLRRPRHPYTRALLNSVPRLGAGKGRLAGIPGSVPSMRRMPSGCRFHPRCPQARAECGRIQPLLVEVEPGHWVRCPYWEAA